MTETLSVVGQSVARNDGLGHVTGHDVYTFDRSFPGMLHLKIVRSPVHHARIRGIDLSQAEKVPGFVRALGAADVPHNVYTILGLIGVEPEEEFLLTPVGERVRYKGEPIIAIAAETEAAALDAVARVRLDLEELPAVFDMDDALAPGVAVAAGSALDSGSARAPLSARTSAARQRATSAAASCVLPLRMSFPFSGRAPLFAVAAATRLRRARTTSRGASRTAILFRNASTRRFSTRIRS